MVATPEATRAAGRTNTYTYCDSRASQRRAPRMKHLRGLGNYHTMPTTGNFGRPSSFRIESRVDCSRSGQSRSTYSVFGGGPHMRRDAIAARLLQYKNLVYQPMTAIHKGKNR